MIPPQFTIIPLVGGKYRQFEEVQKPSAKESSLFLFVEEGEEPSFLLSTEETSGVQIKSYDLASRLVRIDDADVYYPLRRFGSIKLPGSRFPMFESGVGMITLVVYRNTDDFWLKNLVERSSESFGLEQSEDDHCQPFFFTIWWGTRDVLVREGYIKGRRLSNLLGEIPRRRSSDLLSPSASLDSLSPDPGLEGKILPGGYDDLLKKFLKRPDRGDVEKLLENSEENNNDK